MWVEKPSRALIELPDPAMPCQNRHQPSVTPSFRALCVTRMSISGAGTASGEGGSDEMQGKSMLISVTRLSETTGGAPERESGRVGRDQLERVYHRQASIVPSLKSQLTLDRPSSCTGVVYSPAPFNRGSPLDRAWFGSTILLLLLIGYVQGFALDGWKDLAERNQGRV